MAKAFFVVVGFAVAAGLMVAAVVLWTRTLIIFAAPVGVASLCAVWVTIDNLFVYRRKQPEVPRVESGEGTRDTGA